MRRNDGKFGRVLERRRSCSGEFGRFGSWALRRGEELHAGWMELGVETKLERFIRREKFDGWDDWNLEWSRIREDGNRRGGG